MNIKESWKEHPLYLQGLVEMVPTEWVWKYRGVDVEPHTNLKDGTMVSLEELWEDITKEGLHDPLIMRIGIKNNKFRLEAGNHRIQVLHEHNIEMIPVTVHVQAECGPHLENVMNIATHNFDAKDEILITDSTDSTDRYMKPSEVFASLAKLKDVRINF